jgi:hypothetical protein
LHRHREPAYTSDVGIPGSTTRHPPPPPPIAPMRLRAVAIFAVLSICSASAAAAQSLTGRVVDGTSGQPLAAALVQLIAADSTIIAAVTTDDGGAFLLRDGDARGALLRVAQLGYVDAFVPLSDLAAAGATIRLEIDPVEMEALTAEAARENPSLRAAGFYQRQRLGLGNFVTRADLETRFATARRTGDILRTYPRLKIEETREGEEVVLVRSSTDPMGRPCAASVYLQGISIGRSIPRLHPDDIEAFEVYAGNAQIPAQYGGSESGCGVVLIWLRMGTNR